MTRASRCSGSVIPHHLKEVGVVDCGANLLRETNTGKKLLRMTTREAKQEGENRSRTSIFLLLLQTMSSSSLDTDGASVPSRSTRHEPRNVTGFPQSTTSPCHYGTLTQATEHCHYSESKSATKSECAKRYPIPSLSPSDVHRR